MWIAPKMKQEVRQVSETQNRNFSAKLISNKLNQRKSVEKNQKCDQFDKILVPDVFLPQSQG